MAQQSISLPAPPALDLSSPEQLALEAAQQERERRVAEVKSEVSQEQKTKNKKQSKNAPLLDSALFAERQTRVTRTFTLPVELDQELTDVSRMYNVPKSAILEESFKYWWAAVKKTL